MNFSGKRRSALKMPQHIFLQLVIKGVVFKRDKGKPVLYYSLLSLIYKSKL